MTSGFTGLQVLKTTGSGFATFFAMNTQRCRKPTIAFSPQRLRPLDLPRFNCRLDGRPTNDSRGAAGCVCQSVQQIGAAHVVRNGDARRLRSARLIDEITIRMPNQHHLLANLTPFGLKNPNEVFVPTSEPLADIGATIRRRRG